MTNVTHENLSHDIEFILIAKLFWYITVQLHVFIPKYLVMRQNPTQFEMQKWIGIFFFKD